MKYKILSRSAIDHISYCLGTRKYTARVGKIIQLFQPIRNKI